MATQLTVCPIGEVPFLLFDPLPVVVFDRAGCGCGLRVGLQQREHIVGMMNILHLFAAEEVVEGEGGGGGGGRGGRRRWRRWKRGRGGEGGGGGRGEEGVEGVEWRREEGVEGESGREGIEGGTERDGKEQMMSVT